MATNTETNHRQNGEQFREFIVPISELDHLLRTMTESMKQMPKLLKETAAGSSCCIFRVPQGLVEVNPKAYKPHVISIGPYHRDPSKLQMVEEHKWRFLRNMLTRTQAANGPSLEVYLTEMTQQVEQAKECYSEVLSLTNEELVQMLVLDGCFILELLRKNAREVKIEDDDPIFRLPWMIFFLRRDLLKLENQLPFFVLQRLFDLSTTQGQGKQNLSLTELALKFFDEGLPRPEEIVQKHYNLVGKHFLDLFRLSFIPFGMEDPAEDNESAKLIQCVDKLRHAGIKFKPIEAESFLEIKFSQGVLEMPKLTLDDFSSSFLQNCVAFEQSYQHCEMHFTTYTTFLDCLISSGSDVDVLRDDEIIENYFGTNKEVVQLFHELGKDVAFDVERCYLSEQFEKVNSYYSRNWHVHWAGFVDTYFSSPWSFISPLAAFVLLVLTAAQTVGTFHN